MLFSAVFFGLITTNVTNRFSKANVHCEILLSNRLLPSRSTVSEILNLTSRSRFRVSRLFIVGEPFNKNLSNDWFINPKNILSPVLAVKSLQVVKRFRVGKRGYHLTPSLEIWQLDIFGMSAKFVMSPASQPYLVYPELELFDFSSSILSRLARFKVPESTMYESLSGEVPVGVKKYQTGDSLGRVHWPYSLRFGTLMSRTFEESKENGLAILIDSANDSESFNAMLRCAGSIALSASAYGVSSILMSRDGSSVVVKGNDSFDFTELYGYFALVENKKVTSFSDMISEFETYSSSGMVLVTASSGSANSEENSDSLKFDLVISIMGGRSQINNIAKFCERIIEIPVSLQSLGSALMEER